MRRRRTLTVSLIESRWIAGLTKRHATPIWRTVAALPLVVTVNEQFDGLAAEDAILHLLQDHIGHIKIIF